MAQDYPTYYSVMTGLIIVSILTNDYLLLTSESHFKWPLRGQWTLELHANLANPYFHTKIMVTNPNCSMQYLNMVWTAWDMRTIVIDQIMRLGHQSAYNNLDCFPNLPTHRNMVSLISEFRRLNWSPWEVAWYITAIRYIYIGRQIFTSD